MHLPEQRAVKDREQDGDEEKEEDRGPADPRESNERSEDAARAVLVAPAELAPEGLRATGSRSVGSGYERVSYDIQRRWLRRQAKERTG